MAVSLSWGFFKEVKMKADLSCSCSKDKVHSKTIMANDGHKLFIYFWTFAEQLLRGDSPPGVSVNRNTPLLMMYLRLWGEIHTPYFPRGWLQILGPRMLAVEIATCY